ncbi:hypothetical protein GCM10009624_01430 [Gordonia sinesedis]
MIVFRNCDRRWPFLWESSTQPAARWHADGSGPAQYFADTPDGAWAEFLRHEEISDPIDLVGVERGLWCVDITEDPTTVEPRLDRDTMVGDESTYPACQAEAARLRDVGHRALRAPSAALKPGDASGYRVERGFRSGPPRDGLIFVYFGARPRAVGWLVVDRGRPPAELLARIRPMIATSE